MCAVAAINSLDAWSFSERRLIELLYSAIPGDLMEELSITTNLAAGYISIDQVVAWYNDSRGSEQEIIDWYERALIGIREG